MCPDQTLVYVSFIFLIASIFLVYLAERARKDGIKKLTEAIELNEDTLRQIKEFDDIHNKPTENRNQHLDTLPN